MKSVCKYPVPVTDLFHLDIPVGAEILMVQVQHGGPKIWALVDLSRPVERRFFRLAGTGHDIDDSVSLTYIGTFQLNNGNFVGHVFEIGGLNDI